MEARTGKQDTPSKRLQKPNPEEGDAKQEAWGSPRSKGVGVSKGRLTLHTRKRLPSLHRRASPDASWRTSQAGRPSPLKTTQRRAALGREESARQASSRPARPLSAEGRPERRRGGDYPRPGPPLSASTQFRLPGYGCLARRLPGAGTWARPGWEREGGGGDDGCGSGERRGSVIGGFGTQRRARLGGRAPRGLRGRRGG